MSYRGTAFLSVFLCFARIFGEPIGDFSALEAGNHWEYKTIRTGSWQISTTDSLSITKVSVVSQEKSNDTTTYSISISDSTYSIVDKLKMQVMQDSNGHWIPAPESTVLSVNRVKKTERILLEVNGVIQSDTSLHYCLECQMFAKREYEASGLEDTVLNSVPHKVKRAETIYFHTDTRWIMIDGIGLVYYRIGSAATGYSYFVSYSLDKFNDEPVMSTGLSGKRPQRAGPYRVSPLRGYNALGRRLAHPRKGFQSGG